VLAAGAGALLAAWAAPVRADLRVSSLVGDHMVLQQRASARVEGTDVPATVVRVALASTAATTAPVATANATADATGHWRAALPVPAAGGPFRLTIAGSTTLTFTDVLSGEVWLASGQSNMELPLMRSNGATEALAMGCSGIRLFTVAQLTATAPRPDVDGVWKTCDANTAIGFSAAAFYFGREVHRALGVPVGIILATWGGTPAEAWTPRARLLADPAQRPAVEEFDHNVNDPVRRSELERARAAWEDKSFLHDTGNRGERLGYARGRGAGWANMEIPQVWENAGLKIDGAVWFKREVLVPPEWAGRDLALSLGAIDDFDVTYWNGERVGATGAETPNYYAARRRYTVPGQLVKAGVNLLAVRVFDHYGSGGFAGTPSDLAVKPAGAVVAGAAAPTALPLSGTWMYKIERAAKPVAVDFGTRPQGFAADEPQSPSVLWNGMIAPLAGTALAGVIWYQGESNVLHATEYRTLFPEMIRAWRAAWDPGAAAPLAPLPFLFVQLPSFTEGAPALGEGGWAELREAQAMALHEPRTAMAVTLDLGEADNLHPRNKADVGRRLALAALRLLYGRDRIASGPAFVAATREGAAMRVRFASNASGLDTVDGAPPRGFIVAGADRVWHAADARIDGNTVVVSAADVPLPVAVRYAWGNDPPNTLRNQADLPAAPFRSDDWPLGVAGAAPPAAAAR
jgi:sialate O-acetylesterase